MADNKLSDNVIIGDVCPVCKKTILTGTDSPLCLDCCNLAKAKSGNSGKIFSWGGQNGTPSGGSSNAIPRGWCC